MNGKTWTQSEDAFILTHFGRISYREIARRLDPSLTRHQIRGRHIRLIERHIQGAQQGETARGAPIDGTAVETSETNNRLHCVTKSAEIKTLEDLIAYAQVDMKKWHCVRQVVNKWEVGAVVDKVVIIKPLFQVKAWFEPIGETERSEDIRTSLIAEMKQHSPRYAPIQYPHIQESHEKYAVELFIPDPHHGKLCWKPETGDNWESALSERVYSIAIDTLMQRASGLAIDQIILPVGNDFFHTDLADGTTTAGTPQDSDTRWQKTFKRMRVMLVAKIEQLRTIAPVHVIVVPGNHDQAKMYYFGDALECWFNNCSDVSVDNGPRLRKYHGYGASLIAYAHGDKERPLNYPMLMAHEAKPLFAAAKYYEWHLGHLHKREEKKRAIADQVDTDTVDGVVLRRTPSLGGADAWHYGKGYVHSPREADLFLWGKTSGPVGHFTHHYWGDSERTA